MSFNELQKSNYTKKRKEVVIKADGKDITFYANELTHMQKVDVSLARQEGGNWLIKFIVASITDQNGQKMTLQQAEELPQEYADIFLAAVMEVNPATDETENKKKANSA